MARCAYSVRVFQHLLAQAVALVDEQDPVEGCTRRDRQRGCGFALLGSDRTFDVQQIRVDRAQLVLDLSEAIVETLEATPGGLLTRLRPPGHRSGPGSEVGVGVGVGQRAGRNLVACRGAHDDDVALLLEAQLGSRLLVLRQPRLRECSL